MPEYAVATCGTPLRLMSPSAPVGFGTAANEPASPAAAGHVGTSLVAPHTQPWAALESDRSGAWIALDLPRAVTFNMVRLREAIEYGTRIDEFAVETWQDGRWRACAQ